MDPADASRYAAILHAVRSLGLVDLYGRVADRPPRPLDCVCVDDPCTHLSTRDSGGAFDYLFASPSLAEHCRRIVTHDDGETRTLSDHFPVVAEFELPTGPVVRRWDVEVFVREIERRAGRAAAEAVEQLAHWTTEKRHAGAPLVRLDPITFEDAAEPVWRQSINNRSAVCWTVGADGTFSVPASLTRRSATSSTAGRSLMRPCARGSSAARDLIDLQNLQ